MILYVSRNPHSARSPAGALQGVSRGDDDSGGKKLNFLEENQQWQTSYP